MNLPLFKVSGLFAVPSLYFYYLNKNKVFAQEPEIDKNNFLINEYINNRNNLQKLPFLPITWLKKSKQESKSLVEAFRVINNVPGVVVAVSYQGKEVWSFGNGLADIETRAPCTDESVMRIASISKSVTMLLLGKLLEEGKLDLDKPINQYLGDKWPQKYFEKEKVDITLRQLVCHLGGIRHYKYNGNKYNEKDADEFKKEFFLNEFFESVYSSLKLFKDDDLLSKPGTKFHYTTFGFTLISAVIQSVLEKDKKFETELIKLCQEELLMKSTCLDSNEQIIPNRAKYYIQKNSGSNKLINVPEIDNSYKWAGGGLLSSVHDLLKFANAMLYSYKGPEGILKQKTIQLFWTPNSQTSTGFLKDVPYKYGMGWVVADEKSKNKYKGLQKTCLDKVVFHTGSAVGVSSILLILPEEEICVAIIANLGNCSGIGKLAMDIAKTLYQNIEEIYEIN